MAITLRNTKGSALTYGELDGNFTDLNGRVLDSDGIRALVDSDYVQLRQADIFRDSGFVTNIIDSAYVEARISAHYTGFDSDLATKTTTDLSEGTNLYYTTVRADSDFSTKTTTDLTEGTNLYYTTVRFDSDLGAKTTTDLSEGTNLYFTTARFDSDLGTKTTTDLAEGTNLYYTTAKHDSDFTISLAAASLGYTTDSATLWNGTAPTTVDSAVDRIALLVRTLNGGTGA
jgi:hypothetical protein